MDLILTEASAETDAIRLMRFQAADGTALPGYTAGAHVTFDLGAPGTRSYSLVDWNGDAAAPAHYTFAVQREAQGQGGSQAMHALQVGARITAMPPKNDFPVDVTAPALLIAGGIGITPLITMAAQLNAKGQSFALHYAARSRAVAGFLTPLADKFGARFHSHFDDEDPIDLIALCRAAASETHLYVCGPKGMIEATKANAAAAGLAPDHIHFELFATPEAEDGDQPFEVEIADGSVHTIPPGQSIIEVLEAAGVDLIYDCQRGDCGICQTDVLDGDPDHRDVVLSDAEKASGSVMQICVSRAKSARLKLDL